MKLARWLVRCQYSYFNPPPLSNIQSAQSAYLYLSVALQEVAGVEFKPALKSSYLAALLCPSTHLPHSWLSQFTFFSPNPKPLLQEALVIGLLRRQFPGACLHSELTTQLAVLHPKATNGRRV